MLLTGDLEDYEREPGLYLDPRTDLVGAQVREPSQLADAIATATVDEATWARFVAARLEACDGHASGRFVERFVPA